MESAVIGVPHPDFGEGVTAMIIKDRDGALDGGLAKFKLPKRVIIVDDLPRNTMGKVHVPIKPKNKIVFRTAEIGRAEAVFIGQRLVPLSCQWGAI